MDIGVLYWPTDHTLPVPDLARALEDRGFSALWVSEHTHIPVSRTTPWPVNPGTALPESYIRMHDPLIALAAAAAVTETLRLGTSICLLAQRDPIVTAKQVSSIDQLSNGRVRFGVGYGWNLEEVRNHGVRPAQRRGVLREKVEVMRELWTKEVAEYTGEHVMLAPSWQWPKPVQRPGPPVLMGAGSGAFGEIASWADGWIAAGYDKTVSEELPLLRRALDEAGRDRSSFAIEVILSDPTEKLLDEYEAAGVTGVQLFPQPWLHPEIDDAAGLLPLLDSYLPLLDR